MLVRISGKATVDLNKINNALDRVVSTLSPLTLLESIAVIGSLRFGMITELASLYNIDDESAAELFEDFDEQFTHESLPPGDDISPDDSSNH